MATKKVPAVRSASRGKAASAKKSSARARSATSKVTSGTAGSATSTKRSTKKTAATKRTATKRTATKRTATKRTATKRAAAGVKGTITSFNPSTGRGVVKTSADTIAVDLAKVMVKNKSYVRFKPGRSVRLWLDQDAPTSVELEG